MIIHPLDRIKLFFFFSLNQFPSPSTKAANAFSFSLLFSFERIFYYHFSAILRHLPALRLSISLTGCLVSGDPNENCSFRR